MEFETSLLASNGTALAANSLTASSSPLEVLSNAAALLERTKTYDELQTKFSTIKELPTKENKMKRTKDRRELAHSSSFKIKARSGSPLIDEPLVVDRSEHSLSPNFSPAPTAPYTRSTDLAENVLTNNALSDYSTYPGFSHRAGADRDGLLASYRGSPYRPIDGTNSSAIMRRNSDPNSQQSTQSSCDESDDDKPLDMSNKKYRNSECSESQSSSSDSKSEPIVLSKSPPNPSLPQIFGQQMMRPSVITCAPSLMKSQQTPTHPPPPYDQSVLSNSKCHKCCQNGDNSSNYGLDTNGGEYNTCERHRNRLVVTTEEVSDPVIEEHFRRSLGKDYSQIFSNSTNNNSITYSVDDHFAKALGDTWIRLQKTGNRLDESSKPINAQSIAS